MFSLELFRKPFMDSGRSSKISETTYIFECILGVNNIANINIGRNSVTKKISNAK